MFKFKKEVLMLYYLLTIFVIIFIIFYDRYRFFAVKPKKGEKWIFKGNSKDPYPKIEYNPIEILDYNKGWVRYKSKCIDDNRDPIDTFLICYKKIQN